MYRVLVDRVDAAEPRRLTGDHVAGALIEEVVRSASNKGCTLVEAARPENEAALSRWAAMGFAPADPRIQRTVAAVGSTSRRF